MAGRGVPPKDPSERRHRIPTIPMTTVKSDGKKRGPALPNTYEWPEATLAWWEVWRESPQASTFTKTDWSFLLDTAVLHAEFWMGNRSVAGELRLRAAKFGATPEDRARLRLQVGDPDKEGTAAPTRLKSKSEPGRRDRLLRAVADGS